jgi:hypothetical protein
LDLDGFSPLTCGISLPNIGGGRIKRMWDVLRRENGSGSGSTRDITEDDWEEIVDEACYPHLSSPNGRLERTQSTLRSHKVL